MAPRWCAPQDSGFLIASGFGGKPNAERRGLTAAAGFTELPGQIDQGIGLSKLSLNLNGSHRQPERHPGREMVLV